MTATLLSTSPIVSRNIKTDPDFNVYSAPELTRFAELQTRVREFDMFSFEGTLWLEKKWVQILQDCLSFLAEIPSLPAYFPRGAPRKNRLATAAKRRVPIVLLFLEFLSNNVFQTGDPTLVPLYDHFFRVSVPRKALELAEEDNVSQVIADLFREHLDNFQTRLRALKALPVGASPALEYSQEWLTATGRAHVEYPYETITETYH